MPDSRELPHWASVALIARMSRLVLPTFDRCWPNAPPKRRDGLLAGILIAEASAKQARISDELSTADIEATTACGALHSYVLARKGELPDDAYDKSEGFPTDLALAEIATYAATVAAKTTETTRANPAESYPIAMEGLGWAIEVAKASEDQELMDALEEEYESIHKVAEESNWSDDTPVVWKTNGWQSR